MTLIDSAVYVDGKRVSRTAESPDLRRVRERIEAEPALLALGPEAILFALLDEVIDEYEPVVAGLESVIDEIEDQLFGASDDDALTRLAARLPLSRCC